MKKIYDIVICDKNLQPESLDDIAMRTIHYLATDGRNWKNAYRVDGRD